MIKQREINIGWVPYCTTKNHEDAFIEYAGWDKQAVKERIETQIPYLRFKIVEIYTTV